MLWFGKTEQWLSRRRRNRCRRDFCYSVHFQLVNKLVISFSWLPLWILNIQHLTFVFTISVFFWCCKIFRLQGLGMHWPMLHTSSSKKMGLYGSQVLLSQLQIVRERVNSFALLPWYLRFLEILSLCMNIYIKFYVIGSLWMLKGTIILLVFPAHLKIS